MKKVNLVFGTVYGSAFFVAETLQTALVEVGCEVKLHQTEDLQGFIPPEDELLLLVCSSTGHGDLPDGIELWITELKSLNLYLPKLQFSVVALGDSSYEAYCGAGIYLNEFFSEMGAERVGELLKIDACETMEPEIEAVNWLQTWPPMLEKVTTI